MYRFNLYILMVAFLLNISIVTTRAEDSTPPDITVAADGGGDFTTVQQAIESVSDDNSDRIIIFIKDGVYNEKVRIDASYITLRGQSRAGTRIEFSQGAEEFARQGDNLGVAVVNINGNDVVLENLTIRNTHGVIGPHAFAVYGKGDRTVIVDCNVFSDGADTLSLWRGDVGRYYHARLNIRGSVDFVCPRGWCYMTDCTFYQVNPGAEAAIWHDGSKNKDMKFVLRNCRLDGVDGWILARHHHDAQFFLLDCKFSAAMRDRQPKRVIYPLDNTTPTEANIRRNKELDKTNIWGERTYYFNCHRDGGDYPWHADNLSSASGSPEPDQITAAWTFAGTWDPERSDAPSIEKIEVYADRIEVIFSENVTVKGKPRLMLEGGDYAHYRSGSGSSTLVFDVSNSQEIKVSGVDLNGGFIIATQAAAALREANLSLPQPRG
ncbi:MAG: hypothetical protein JW715_11265 [Sedimentisphaerales bacterium]|nr:hypothetical protein [Sedimentisphaerales bacterium]